MAGIFVKEIKFLLVAAIILIASAYSFVFISSILAFALLIVSIVFTFLFIDRVHIGIKVYKSGHPTIHYCKFCNRHILNSTENDSFCSSCTSLILLL